MADQKVKHDEVIDQPTLRPRDRIVVTAREMFQQHGIKGVGVDAIAEAAHTNKMTLYRHFGSKDHLIVECMQKCVDEGSAWWCGLETDHPGDPRAQLRAWVEHGAAFLRSGERGCEMANAAVELADGDHPAKRVIEEAKKAHRDRLAELCKGAGLSRPELAADMLALLLEGAKISRQSEGLEGPSARFRRMADEIIVSFGGSLEG
ncbi:TetR family transcriptional regulator [Mesorhizobium sp. L-8-10]|nr:TetR family transcriptional regulator [Mesorhizobium sp. L-8-10]